MVTDYMKKILSQSASKGLISIRSGIKTIYYYLLIGTLMRSIHRMFFYRDISDAYISVVMCVTCCYAAIKTVVFPAIAYNCPVILTE